jgi:hypothetical protein
MSQEKPYISSDTADGKHEKHPGWGRESFERLKRGHSQLESYRHRQVEGLHGMSRKCRLCWQPYVTRLRSLHRLWKRIDVHVTGLLQIVRQFRLDETPRHVEKTSAVLAAMCHAFA